MAGVGDPLDQSLGDQRVDHRLHALAPNEDYF